MLIYDCKVAEGTKTRCQNTLRVITKKVSTKVIINSEERRLGIMLDRMYIKAMCRVNEMMNDEKGDTNFISVLIILGIVVILAGVFMGFKDTIVKQVNDLMKNFKIH
jgi:hypothetical protein